MSTGRRSFLSNLVAGAAGLVGSLFSRRALSGPAPSDDVPASQSMASGRRSAGLFRQFGPMVDEMFEHLCNTGHMVLNADDPGAGLIGFSTFGPDPSNPSEELSRHWAIPLTRVGGRQQQILPRCFHPHLRAETANRALTKLLQSKDGRMELAAYLLVESKKRHDQGLGPVLRPVV